MKKIFIIVMLLAILTPVFCADGPDNKEKQQAPGIFDRVVSFATSIMFFDPFAALGMYDPIIRNDDGTPILDAKGKPKKVVFPLVVLWLIVSAIFFTIKLKFINFRGVFHAISLLRGHYSDPKSPGDLTHFQALSTALSGTVGLGNIAGVALAISIGGPGATLWMILAGIFGMSLKFAECTLGVKYREVDASGEVAGGPMYYLNKAFAKEIGQNLEKFWDFPGHCLPFSVRLVGETCFKRIRAMQ